LKWITNQSAALVTDLYELTMAESYFREDMNRPATFELWVRDLAVERNFLVAAGLADALDFITEFHFDDDAIEYLATLGRFSTPFLDHLRGLKFEGDVWAMPEGTVVFAAEPIIRVTAPLIQAQIVETFLLNAIGLQTLVASKAARVHIAAAGRDIVDFGARRGHGADAALKGARAAYLAGASATSLVATGYHYGIPVTGTMAHSFVLAHGDERAAFEAFARSFPDHVVLLIDTYDTVAAAKIVADLAPRLGDEGITVSAVRLDSGDLGVLAGEVRQILDNAGLEDIQILASGALDEHRIAGLLAAGAPIDGFGVGTSMITSSDSPNLDIVYKLVDDWDGPVMKTSPGKANLPGVKQVFRRATGDVIALADEGLDGLPLLTQVVEQGRLIGVPRSLPEIREATIASIDALPPGLRRLDGPADSPWVVEVSPRLRRLADDLASQH